MLNFIMTQDRDTTVNLGMVFDMEAVRLDTMPSATSLIAHLDTDRFVVLGRFASKEMAMDVLADILTWNEIDKIYEDVPPTYRIPQDNPEYDTTKDAINLPGAQAKLSIGNSRRKVTKAVKVSSLF